MSHHRETVNADPGPPAAGPYSHAVKSNGLVFLSGQTPVDPDTGQLVEGSIGDQTRRCLDNLAIVAEAAGASWPTPCVSASTSPTSRPSRTSTRPTRTYFGDEPPARSTIGVAALPLGAEVEIDMVLALPD